MTRPDEVEAWEIMLNIGLLPLKTYPGPSKPWKCLHLKCGRTVDPTYTQIKQRRTRGCPGCAGNTVEHDQVIATMLAHNLQPLTRYPGSQAPWECECIACGNTVQARYVHVKHRGTGCPHCAKRCPKTCSCRNP